MLNFLFSFWNDCILLLDNENSHAFYTYNKFNVFQLKENDFILWAVLLHLWNTYIISYQLNHTCHTFLVLSKLNFELKIFFLGLLKHFLTKLFA